MKLIICAALTAATIGLAAPAGAAPCTGVLNQSGCQPAPWNGQLQDTWNVAGTYGGWVNTPVACDPRTAKCGMWAQP